MSRYYSDTIRSTYLTCPSIYLLKYTLGYLLMPGSGWLDWLDFWTFAPVLKST